MFKVVEIAEELGVSKVSVYNKIKQNSKDLKPHLSKLKGVTYIDDKGFQIIKDSFSLQEEVKTEHEKPNEETTYTADNTKGIADLKDTLKVKNEQLKDLKEHMEFLENQVHVKDELIKDQNKQLENFQVLLLNEQKKNMLLDNKMDQDPEVAATTQEKISFFKKIFKKWHK